MIIKTAILVALGSLSTSAAFAADVKIIQASYGLSCGGNLRDNMTNRVMQECKSKSLCHFTIDHEKHGDPAPMCKKNFVVDYSCGGSSTVKTASIAAEASKQYVTLDCSQQVNAYPLVQPQPVWRASTCPAIQFKGARHVFGKHTLRAERKHPPRLF